MNSPTPSAFKSIADRPQTPRSRRVRASRRSHLAVLAIFCAAAVSSLFCSCSKANNNGAPAKQVMAAPPTNSTAGHYQGVTNILSAQTKALLESLKESVAIRFYVTPYAREVSPDFVEVIGDLLAEYQRVASGRIVVKQITPQSAADFETAAKADRVDVTTIPDFGTHCLGVAMQCGTTTMAIPSFNAIKVRQLEYHLTRCIQTTAFPSKPVIGLMSTLPLWGASNSFPTATMTNTRPWFVLTELQNNYEVRRLEPDASSIPDSISILLVVNPKNTSLTTQYAIDQFLMRGGNMMAFLDPLSLFDYYSKPLSVGVNPLQPTGLEPLLKTWGISFDPTNAVADMTFIKPVSLRGKTQRLPAVLFLDKSAMNTNDVLTCVFDNIQLAYAGAFVGQPSEGLREDILLHSSKYSRLSHAHLLELAGESFLESFKPTDVSYPLAVRLVGRFKSSFPGGLQPVSSTPPATATNTPSRHLSASVRQNCVILVADSDLLLDSVCVQTLNLMGKSVAMKSNENVDFILDALDQLACGLFTPLLPDLITEKRLWRFSQRTPIKLPPSESLDEITRSVTNLISMPLEEGEAILSGENSKEWHALITAFEKQAEEVKASLSALEASKPSADRGKLDAQQSKLFADFKVSESDYKEKIKQLQARYAARKEALGRLHGITNVNSNMDAMQASAKGSSATAGPLPEFSATTKLTSTQAVARATSADSARSQNTPSQPTPRIKAASVKVVAGEGSFTLGTMTFNSSMQPSPASPCVWIIRRLEASQSARAKELGIEVGKAYLAMDDGTLKFLKPVDLSKSDHDIAAEFGLGVAPPGAGAK